MTDSLEFEKKHLGKQTIIIGIASFLLIAVCCMLYLYSLTNSPQKSATAIFLEIEKGMSVQAIAQKAEDEGIVKSNLLLYAILTYFHEPTAIFAGTYVFEEPLSVFDVARKLASSDISEELITITLPEGIRLTDMANIASQELPQFDVDDYLINTNELEGYLFPETYFVPDTFTAEDLINLQKTTYEEKVGSLRNVIASSTFSEYEVLILASILEREANDETSMKYVSGILQNRLAIGMALQADASIEYVLDKPLKELTAKDLKIDSPYNTYLYPGLVPTPIGNPGLQAIEAVLYPTESDYFYYITDEDGVFHYAETFNEHKANIARYLR